LTSAKVRRAETDIFGDINKKKRAERGQVAELVEEIDRLYWGLRKLSRKWGEEKKREYQEGPQNSLSKGANIFASRETFC